MTTSVNTKLGSFGNEVIAETNPVTGGNILSSGGEDVLSPALSFIGVQSSHPFMNGLISNIRELQGADANEKHLSSLEAALRPLVASTAWQKIRELWVPTGNTLTAALVKIKAAIIADGTENRSLINVNFVSGDYSPTVGITGDGSSKYLYSQCTPYNALRTAADAAACAVKNYGFAAYPTKPVHSAAGYLLGAGMQGSNYLNLGGFGDASGGDVIGTTSVKRGVNPLVPTGHRVRMQFVQNYNNLMQAGTGGLVEAEIAATETSVSQDKIFLFVLNNGSNSPNAATYYAGTISGYALFDGMTQAELKQLSIFFDDINFALGRIGKDIVICGDSGAANTAVSMVHRWPMRVAQDLGSWKVAYSGVSGTRSRTSGINTLTFTANHDFATGDCVQIFAAGGTGYDTDSSTSFVTLPTAQITVTGPTTFTYPAVSPTASPLTDEGTTGMTACYAIRGCRNFATNGATISACPTVGIGGSANTYNQWTWPVWSSGATPASRAAYLYRMFQFPASFYIFHIGLNDCQYEGNISKFEAAYRDTMTKILATGINPKRIILNSGYWFNHVFQPPAVSAKTDALFASYNATIQKIAIDYGCSFCDISSLWNSTNYATYLIDESGTNGGYTSWLHPNAAGCDLIYRKVMEVIAGINI